MRGNLRGVLSRVDRMGAQARRFTNELNPRALVEILHRGRDVARRGAVQRMSEDELRAKGRGLRQRLREAGARWS